MIKKIEFEENKISNSFALIIDFQNNNMKYYQNNELIKEDIIKNENFIKKLISAKTLDWNNEYIDNSVIDGSSASIKITENKEYIYTFKNKYPSDYQELIKEVKELAGIYE